MMDHDTIENGSVVERYVTGRLDEDEALAFEEHLLDCPPCIERVEAAERLQRGLAVMVAEDAATVGAVATAAAFTRWRWRAYLPLVWGAVLVVLVAGFGMVLADRGRENERLRHELASARDALRQGTATRAAELEERLAEAETALTTAEQDRRRLAQTLERWKAPILDLPITLLTPLRGTDETFGVELPSEGRFIGLWIELGGEEHAAYRARLLDPGGEERWAAEGLRFNELGALFVQLPVDRLHPGRWSLEVEGLGLPGERPVPLATFGLEIRSR